MIVPVFLPHLGCKERCIYCNQDYITDLKGHDLQSIIEKSLSAHTSRFEVGLFGGNIFGIEQEVLTRLFALFEGYRERITNFRCSTKPVPLRRETLEILMKNNVTVIELGVPCFNDGILRTLNRNHRVEELYRTYNTLMLEGFHVALQVMVGLPGETMEDIAATAEHLISLKPDYIRIYPLVVLRETPLHGMYERGEFVPLPFEEAVRRALFLYLKMKQHGIKVVKMGLTDNEIIGERVVAGHYHPAFGYVVKSWAFYLALMARMDGSSMRGNVVVSLNNRDIPHLLGDKRSNIVRFKEQGIAIAWEKGDMEQGTFRVRSGSRTVSGSILDALEILNP
jgi:histone acetyltransferase (RNA polymerase elongator complex component)